MLRQRPTVPDQGTRMHTDAIFSAEDLSPGQRAAISQNALDELKYRLHDRLVQQLDLAEVRRLPDQNRRAELRLVVAHLLAADGPTLEPETREALITEVLDELVGLGPIDKLLRDPGTGDILVNGP
jgi:pilus assembly protein CpaF